jgi:hypothetical protein
METLEIATVRELEDLVIDCVYERLIDGKLNQKLKVQSACVICVLLFALNFVTII